MKAKASNSSAFGLKESDLATICQILQKYPEIKSASIYGSRATGNYKQGSDIDLALFGDIDYLTLGSLAEDLEATTLPYFFDLLIYKDLTNKKLKGFIDEEGIEIYIAI